MPQRVDAEPVELAVGFPGAADSFRAMPGNRR